MGYKQMCKNTKVEIDQQFNRKVYNNIPVFGKYKNNKYNSDCYVLLKGTYDADSCVIVNVNGFSWDGVWSDFYTTSNPPAEVLSLYHEGFFK